MIIEAETTEVVTNIPEGRTKPMFISQEGLAHIMSTLTNLYHDPELAVIREITANAIDSHIASGQTRKIEISLPDRYTNQFIVEDWGVGMSYEDLDNLCRGYGESTKRKRNDQIGAFGLGFKSPLAIANSFTVRGIKDGRLTTVIIAKSADGLNNVTTVAKQDTDLPNGVKVSIPVPADKRISFNEKAKRFFRFSEPSLLSVDGVEPTSVYTSARKVTDPDNPDFVAYIGDETMNESVVVMGGVPYAMTYSEMCDSLERQGLTAGSAFYRLPKIFPIGIGEVELTPNREGLRYTDKTIEVVDRLLAGFLRGYTKSAQEAIDAIDERSEVYDEIRTWAEKLDIPAKDIQWRGEDVVREIRLEKPVATVRPNVGWTSRNEHATRYSIELDRKIPVLIITGRGTDKYRRVATYINDYMALKNHRYRDLTFTFVEELTEEMKTPWLIENSNFSFIDAEAFMAEVKEYRKSLKPEKEPAEKKERVKITYPVFDIENNALTYAEPKDIPEDAYLVRPEDFTSTTAEIVRIFEAPSGWGKMLKEDRKEICEAFAEAMPNVKHLVFLSSTRKLETLERKSKMTFPALADLAPTFLDEIETAMEDADLHHYRYCKKMAEYDFFYGLAEEDGILDPQFAQLRADESLAPKAERLERFLKAYNTLRRPGDRFAPDNAGRKPESIEFDDDEIRNRYILMRSMGLHSRKNDATFREHLISYMNTVYSSTLVESEDN
jgi:hypothetical protein